MSPNAPTARIGKPIYFSTPVMNRSPGQESPTFTWQQQALGCSKIHDLIGKQQEKMSTRGKHPLPSLTMSAQTSPKKFTDDLPIIINTRYNKNNSQGDYGANDTDIRKDRCQARPSSVSTCGDLEGPYRVTPRKSHLPINGENHGPILQPEDQFEANGYDGDYNRRSRSRTSNISRKRSSVNKYRPKPDPERKKMLMHQVAQYWNECISIAEEEKAQARLEVDQLREDLRRQQAKLKESHQLLDRERAQRRDCEQQLKDSEEKNAAIVLENSTLVQESATIKEEVRSSKERAAILTEKSKTYRAKLNEAILEQQRLFIQAKEFYHDSIEKLRQENDARVLETKAIEAALTNSREKREQIKRCMDELRSGLEKEVEDKGREIAQLRDRITTQEQALCTEKKISSDLRNQIRSVKPLQSAEVQGLVNTVESLHESISTNVVSQSQQLELSKGVCNRLQALEEAVEGIANHATQENNIGSLLKGLQKLISTDVFAALADIGGAQSCTYETLVGIRNDCQTELGVMCTRLSGLAQQQKDIQEQGSTKSNESIGRLNTMQAEVNSVRQLCENISENMTTWFTEERTVVNEERDLWGKRVVCRLNEGNERIDELEKIVHEAGHTCLSKFDSFGTAVATRDDETKLALQNMMDNFRCALDQDLHVEKLKAEYDATQTQKALAALEDHVVSISKQLKEYEARPSNLMGSSGQDTQDEEVVSLRDKISHLEKEASKNADLQKRWHSDIEIVDSVRSKLKSLQQLPSQHDGYSEQLAKFSQVSSMLDSASNYLAEQEIWVKQQLGTSSPQIDSNVVTPPWTVKQLSSSRLLNPDDRAHDSQISKIDRLIGIESDGVKTTQHSHPENGSKRVQVQSPTEVHSPSSPPSIEQEQKRRRIPVTMRPILKANSLASSQESFTTQEQSNETETELGPVPESRKIMTTISNASMASQRIIAEISSGFITDKAEESIFSLPRVADFQPPLEAVPSQVIPLKRKFGVDGDECTKFKRDKVLSGLMNRPGI
ncbi:hypothetical protein NOR_00437 [Metarhizium rileyi]|uniref:Uncharacterized protein n=1 Tax=Metarhizium rileyi (strain RCEF 4871) TaxID=1649241 RepID=A0A167KKB6_METRR|nr:hypothetical protein NOR_00437 [Metarhizium rileyi RCEF 4871]